MAGFKLRLLGAPGLTLGAQILSLPTRKLWAIVAYLGAQAEAVPRKKLAELLWENHPDERARANLRQELHRLRGSEVEGLLVSLEDTLELATYSSDLREVRKHFEAQNWAGVLEQYQGEFAQGLQVRGAGAFEDWLTLEREHWKSLWQEAARRQGHLLEQAGRLKEARTLYAQILSHDPFQEDLQRALIRLTAQTEGTPAALGVFNTYKALLDKEFSLSPLPQTLELVAQLQSGQSQGASSAESTALPTGLTQPKLVGRQREWALMEAAWQQGQAIYLSGPPGIGKSRLMLEFATSKGPYLHQGWCVN